MGDFVIDCFLPISIIILVAIVIILGIYVILLTTGTWVIDKELQQRIDEAIEYIEDNMKEEYIHTDYIYTMIKILRGE